MQMKRLVTFIAIVVLLFMSSANAEFTTINEHFSIRNGISFKDTIDEVVSKETVPLKNVSDATDIDPQTPYHIRSEKSTFANIPESEIWYKFNSAKELREVVYSFRIDSKSKAAVDSDYLSINNGLREKYGTPLGYEYGKAHVLQGYALTTAFKWVAMGQMFGQSVEILAYDEWLVEQEGYYVKIEQVEQYNIGYYLHQVSYTYFSKEDVSDLMTTIDENHSNVINDL